VISRSLGALRQVIASSESFVFGGQTRGISLSLRFRGDGAAWGEREEQRRKVLLAPRRTSGGGILAAQHTRLFCLPCGGLHSLSRGLERLSSPPPLFFGVRERFSPPSVPPSSAMFGRQKRSAERLRRVADAITIEVTPPAPALAPALVEEEEEEADVDGGFPRDDEGPRPRGRSSPSVGFREEIGSAEEGEDDDQGKQVGPGEKSDAVSFFREEKVLPRDVRGAQKTF